MASSTGGLSKDHATIPGLDGLRASAIVIVMCSHVGLEHIMPGRFGVTLFFFLSGFLITTLLRREIETSGRIDFRQFYLRRVVRIMPPMYITIASFAVLSLIGLIHQLAWRAVPFDLAFLTNYFPLSGVPIGLWSLAVEEHFYFAFPLSLALLARRFSFAQCAAIFAGVCVLVLLVRVWEVHRLADFEGVNFWTHTRIDSILFGSILALWNNPVADERTVVPSGVTGYAVAVVLLAPTFLIRDEAFRQTYRYTLQGVGLFVLFNTIIRDRGWVSQLLNNRLTKQIALLSYTLYLVHGGFILVFAPGDGTHPMLTTLAAFAASIVYAVAMNRLVERPLNRWRRRTETAWAQEDAAPLPNSAPSA